jgi:urease accessory protein
LSLAGQSAGRIGGVRLELAANSEGTFLSQCYQQIPLRVLPPFRRNVPALIYLLNPTAGLMDGDGHLVEIHAGSGSRAVVTGQSATRIHPAVQSLSTQQWHVRVDAGAVLVVLPGPAIPFHGARYYQRVRIDLAEGAGLVWGDIWLAGRYSRGANSERFQFEMLIQDFEAYRENRLVFRDRFAWQGPWDAEKTVWHFGSHHACGSLFVTGSVPESILSNDTDCQRAFFPTAAHDTCLRWLGSSEKVTEELVKTALNSAGKMAGSETEPAWLLGNHDLAPNHWFIPAYCPRDAVPCLDEAMGIPSGNGRPATSKSRSYK